MSQAITPAIESGIQDTVGSYYQYTPPVEDSGDGSTPGDAFFDELPLEDVLAALQDSSSTAASLRISSRRWRTAWRPSPPTPSGRWRSMWRCS